MNVLDLYWISLISIHRIHVFLPIHNICRNLLISSRLFIKEDLGARALGYLLRLLLIL